jgi:hypothetical protein
VKPHYRIRQPLVEKEREFTGKSIYEGEREFTGKSIYKGRREYMVRHAKKEGRKKFRRE